MPDTMVSQAGAIRVVRTEGSFGARIEGFDREAASDAATRALLVEAFHDHQLLAFPGAPMTPETMRAFTSIFGDPVPQVLRYKRVGDVPEVSRMVSTIKPDGGTDKTAIRSETWHSDDSYMETPAKATILHAHVIPSHGGATWFCDMYGVYAALPDALRRRVDGRMAVHGYDTVRAKNRPSARTPQEIAETPDVIHPLVRTHPETGRRALYLNFNRLDHIVGMPRDESDALLDELAAFAEQPRFHYGHRWTVGDAILWDNRCLMHRVVIDYPPGEERIMLRTLLRGDRPV
ncbi:MAG: TauD/TfdA family dioxygenase [Rhodospirillales bacterium]|nr:MAG: TauD/TfdA family dioxygenase [Rhodospirillales bacterium]